MVWHDRHGMAGWMAWMARAAWPVLPGMDAYRWMAVQQQTRRNGWWRGRWSWWRWPFMLQLSEVALHQASSRVIGWHGWRGWHGTDAMAGTDGWHGMAWYGLQGWYGWHGMDGWMDVLTCDWMACSGPRHAQA